MLIRSVIFAGALQGLYLILLLRAKNKNPGADRWLMRWFLLVSIQLFFYYDQYQAVPFLNEHFSLLAFSIPLLSSPVLFQYILSLASNQKVGPGRLTIYLLPWICYLVLTTFIQFSHPADLYMQFGYPHFLPSISLVTVYLFTLPMAIVPGSYAILGFIVLLRYQKRLPDNYSFTEQINLNWLKWLAITIPVLFLILFIFIRYGSQGNLVGTNKVFLYVGALLSLYVFLIGYFGLRQSSLLMSLASTTGNKETEIPYKKSGLDKAAVEQLYLRLLAYMEEQKPYLRDDLSLSQLAGELAIPSNHLSQVINQQSGSNFFVFVNAYRVAEVKKRLLDPSFSHLSILGIALDCGFRSKSAFNRIFKEQVGVGPREFQQNKSPL